MAQEFKEVAHLKVDQKAYGDGWDRIFSKGTKEEISAKEEVAEVVAEKMYDHFMIFYCVLLACLGCLFLGSEVSDMKHSAEIRKAKSIINNCNNIIVGKKK